MPNATITRATKSKPRHICNRLLLCVCSMLLCLVSTAATAGSGDVTLLKANFDNKPVGISIGTGGAALGEPVTTDPLVQAVVVGPGPYDSNSLRFSHTSTTSARFMRFQFINDQEVTARKLQLSAKLSPSNLKNYYLYIREAFGAASVFANIALEQNGDISLTDAGMGVDTTVGTFAAGDVIHLVFLFDLSGGTYSLLINGSAVFVGRPHGVTNGRGIGAIIFGSNANSGDLFIDDIEVTYLNEETFADGFE